MATSTNMNVDQIARFARLKGLNIVGTGDFAHPKWLRELKEKLTESKEEGLYALTGLTESPVRFMMTCEVSTIFDSEGNSKKIHHVIMAPNIETAEQINDRIASHGNLESDGRPVLDMSASQLVEEVMEVSVRNEVFPAHAWTPWFSLFGALSGFDRIEDCYQDMTKYVHALETGLSSDPPMNWRLSALDKFTLLSNSDSHSCWPWRIGREANVFDLESPAYCGILNAIRRKDTNQLKFTIETDPAYGKYHWTGHRRCGASFSAVEALKIGGFCPKCRKKLTKGVEQRVEELADRPAGFCPAGVHSYIHLLPLSEIISTVLGVDFPGIQKVWSIYDSLVSHFGSEYSVLIEAPFEDITKLVDRKIAEAIIRVREGRIKIIPGYDGVYGQMVIFQEHPTTHTGAPDAGENRGTQTEMSTKPGQKSLRDFI